MSDSKVYKIPCEHCSKPISVANKTTHLKKCKGENKLMTCNQKDCFFSTALRKEFKRHVKEEHSLSVQFYTLHCLACKSFVVRKTVHIKQKKHIQKACKLTSDPIIRRFSFRILPFRKKKTYKNKKRKRDMESEEIEETVQSEENESVVDEQNSEMDELLFPISAQQVQEEFPVIELDESLMEKIYEEVFKSDFDPLSYN